ncbi:MAG: hypothetical protein ABUL60_22500 [Myxococcales bacterium]
MASRAHVIHDYSFSNPQARPRRQIRYRDDPVVVPRSSVWRAGGGVVVSALALGAIVAASAYAAYHPEPPALAETPSAPLLDTWQLDPLVQDAHVTNLLAGPARAVPNRAAPNAGSFLDDEPFISTPPDQVIINDSAQGVQEHLPGVAPEPAPASTAPEVAEPKPYPNPTTTPPEAIAPTSPTPQTSTLDPENPYRD